MRNIFTEHPHSVGETYVEHLRFAGGFGINMLIAGFACIVHAIFPFLFQKTGSTILKRSFQQFLKRTPTIDDDSYHEIVQLIDAKKGKFIHGRNARR